MDHFQEGSPERTPVIKALVSSILSTYAKSLKTCSDQEDARDLYDAFPGMLQEACKEVNEDLKKMPIE